MSIQPSTNKQNSIVESTGMRKRTPVGASASVSTIASKIKITTAVALTFAAPVVAETAKQVTNATHTRQILGMREDQFWTLYFCSCMGLIYCCCVCCDDDKNKHR